MAIVSCFSALLVGKKKKSKKYPKPSYFRKENGIGDLRVKPEEIVYAPSDKEVKEVPLKGLVPLKNQVSNRPSTDKKLVGDNKNNEISARTDVAIETAYEGGDEHDDILSMKRDYSDFDLQALATEKGDINSHDLNQELTHDGLENESEKVDGITPELLLQSGHVSDPGMGRTAFWGSPMLKRSCSNIETKRASKLLRSPSKSQSYDDLQKLPGKFYRDVAKDIPGSPASVMTSCSADKVMLKKRSSSQVLPSRSRKLWWKLFLWSHRNLHRTWSLKPQRTAMHNHASNQKDGYSSDTLEPRCGADQKNKKAMEESVVGSRNGVWPTNQWVAFSAESSSLDRVNAWVHSLDDSPFCPIEDDENEDDEAAEESVTGSKILEIGESSSRNNNARTGWRAVEEILQANNLIQSLNSFSSVAHISSMGLKVIPAIAGFNSLRSVNLSGNFIVHISPGSLPKSLHMLDLSRNKIATIEGLRELTRLRVLNLSYNRISRIGHGLSNCTLIKELYLAGNKISGVEGLHRLLKLAVLDLSFNKITTARALGQLVANYHSLVALNLLGNPVQSNIGDDQLRKVVCSLLPQLAYLNKQPIKPVRAREAATDSVAKAALRNNSWSSRRRSNRRVGISASPLVKGIGEGSNYRGAGSSGGYRSSRNKSKNRHQHSIPTSRK